MNVIINIYVIIDNVISTLFDTIFPLLNKKICIAEKTTNLFSLRSRYLPSLLLPLSLKKKRKVKMTRLLKHRRRSHPCRRLSESEVSKGRRNKSERASLSSSPAPQLTSRLSEASGAQLHHLRTELDPLGRTGGLIYPSTTDGPGRPTRECTLQLKRVYRD